MRTPVIAKYVHVAGLLERRLRHGDYLLKEFPTDRQLSAEFAVDVRTARKAVAQLIGAGLLYRQPNGRPAASQEAGRQAHVPTKIALLSVAYPSPYAWRWQQAIARAVDARGAMFRPVTYVHLDDAIVQDTLDGFDAVFFGLFGQDPTDHLLHTVHRGKAPVVFLDADLSSHGLPSLWLASPTMTRRLLEHLAERGHRRVACLNTQPHNAVTQERIGAWRRWAEETNGAGRLVDSPVEAFGSPTEQAYRVALEALDSGGFDATAILCCTSAAARGVYRALHERGLRVGEDMAVCSGDDGAGEARFFVPSLTAIQDPDPDPYLSVCLDWMQRRGRDWQGPLLVQPRDVPLFVGESTHPAPTTTARRP